MVSVLPAYMTSGQVGTGRLSLVFAPSLRIVGLDTLTGGGAKDGVLDSGLQRWTDWWKKPIAGDVGMDAAAELESGWLQMCSAMKAQVVSRMTSASGVGAVLEALPDG